MPKRVEVELDIFSGMPNPKWVLTEAEAARFETLLEHLPPGSARELLGNLGYRGLIVEMTEGGENRSIQIQAGIVRIVKSGTDAYSKDADRMLERWLLGTGKPHMKDEIFQIANRELR